MYLYACHKNATKIDPNCTSCIESILSIFRSFASLPVADSAFKSTGIRDPRLILCGAVDDDIAQLLQSKEILYLGFSNIETPYLKYIFERPSLTASAASLAPGLSWGALSNSDHYELVISRSKIFRQAATLASCPSLAVFCGDSPIAWCFVSADGSISTLHVEPEWRGRGLAKMIASRAIDPILGSEGYAHADVGLENVASRGVCENVGGQYAAKVYWLRVDLDRVRQAQKIQSDSA